MDPAPLILTAKLASMTTLVLFVTGVPLAYWLAYGRLGLRSFIEPLVALPMVLPPTVLGFYLLVLFGPRNPFGAFFAAHGMPLVFSFEGLLLASVIAGLPFMVAPVKAGFDQLPPSLREASYSLGKGRIETLLRVLLPAVKPALVSGIAMTFAHTMGELGVVMMIGGNIPGKTLVASVAVFSSAESLDFASANAYAAVLAFTSFVMLAVLYHAGKDTRGAR
jgi:molybdate transport system permease protein